MALELLAQRSSPRSSRRRPAGRRPVGGVLGDVEPAPRADRPPRARLSAGAARPDRARSGRGDSAAVAHRAAAGGHWRPRSGSTALRRWRCSSSRSRGHRSAPRGSSSLAVDHDRRPADSLAPRAARRLPDEPPGGERGAARARSRAAWSGSVGGADQALDARPARSSAAGPRPARPWAPSRAGRGRGAMSGWRCWGSSTGSASKTISERDSVTSITVLASSSSVNSFGLPMLTGEWTSDSARATMPRIRSST